MTVEKISPGMQQYLDIKKDYPCLLYTSQNKPVKVAVDVEFYDGDGNKSDLTRHNAIVALNSLNHWTGASYVDSGDKSRAITLEAKDVNGNTVRGTWDPYADGSSMSLSLIHIYNVVPCLKKQLPIS